MLGRRLLKPGRVRKGNREEGRRKRKGGRERKEEEGGGRGKEEASWTWSRWSSSRVSQEGGGGGGFIFSGTLHVIHIYIHTVTYIYPKKAEEDSYSPGPYMYIRIITHPADNCRLRCDTHLNPKPKPCRLRCDAHLNPP